MWPRRRTEERRERDAAISRASAETAESLSRAKAERAREQAALGRDSRLIESLREIRSENHFTDIVDAAFRGEP